MPAPTSRHLVICADGLATDGAGTMLAFSRWLASDRDQRLLHQPACGGQGRIAQAADFLVGRSLPRDVLDMAAWLAAQWRPGDTVWLFGTGRGAFAVRALAALLHRVGLPPADAAPAVRREAWRLLRRGSAAELQQFQQRHGAARPDLHFLGLWDSPRCCGVLRPLQLPHLRHNPAVQAVRHAIAMDERRGWFELLPWGWLARDRRPGSAALALPQVEQSKLAAQDVREVLFPGTHEQMGEGNPLTWMLAEAVLAGLRPSAAGVQRLRQHAAAGDDPPPTAPAPDWRLADALGRFVPQRGRAVHARGPAPRDPAALRRAAPWIGVHVSGVEQVRGVPVMPVPTRSRRALGAVAQRARAALAPAVGTPAEPPDKPGSRPVFLHHGKALAGST